MPTPPGVFQHHRAHDKLFFCDKVLEKFHRVYFIVRNSLIVHCMKRNLIGRLMVY